jgi:RNA polymerase sigma-70 factor (ECF subfamily)
MPLMGSGVAVMRPQNGGVGGKHGAPRPTGVQNAKNLAPLGSTPGPIDLGPLYLAEFRHVLVLLQRLGIPRDEVEDVAHEAFLKAIRFSATFDCSKPGGPWLLSIAHRAAIDHLRYTLRHTQNSTAPTSVDPTRALLAADLVAAGLSRIAPIRRRVFELCELLGFSIAESARMLGISMPCAYTRYRVARSEFASALREPGEADIGAALKHGFAPPKRIPR